ncbi:MAG: hypothetical protein RBU30_06220 [Polyangia bacterium]|nr:hypothetical protein [Polyangia bacterium]
MSELLVPVLAAEGESFLSSGEMIAIGVGAGLVALVIIIAIVVKLNRRSTNMPVESCPKCNSMNVQNRAGLFVCMDCGHSVKVQEAQA